MEISLQRSVLFKALQLLNGIVERRQTQPILANLLLVADSDQLSLTGTDIDIELVVRIPLLKMKIAGAITVSAKKLFDICRSLPDDASIDLRLESTQMICRSGKSRFNLMTLPAVDFPVSSAPVFNTELTMNQSMLKTLLGKVHFAMGQQEVRHYLNGVLIDIHDGAMRCVATDGHRLALSTMNDVCSRTAKTSVILPRKSVLELMRLLGNDTDSIIQISLNENDFRMTLPAMVFTSKLINASFPAYARMIPREASQPAVLDREALRQSLSRSSILLNEKFCGVSLQFSDNMLRLSATNPEHESVEEFIPLSYTGPTVELAFNVVYLLDVVSLMTSHSIRWSFSDASKGTLIQAVDAIDDTLYVVMPVKL